jgi:hypothetical protein
MGCRGWPAVSRHGDLKRVGTVGERSHSMLNFLDAVDVSMPTSFLTTTAVACHVHRVRALSGRIVP